MGDHSPDMSMTALETVVPAILGLTAAAILAVTACFCIKRVRTRNKKTNEASFPFQPTRRPTAVRSPSGAPPHYLKKSPSPTAPKPPPGNNNHHHHHHHHNNNTNGHLNNTLGANGGTGGGGVTPITPPESSQHQQQQQQTQQHQQHQSPQNVQHMTKYIEENEKSYLNESKLSPELESPSEQNENDNENGKLGTLVFKLRFLSDRSALVVSVVRCRGLPGRAQAVTGSDVPSGANGKIQNATDPYVKLQLLPEKQHKVKTRVVRNTRNPVYDEDFTFYGLSITELSSMSLHFVVLSFDRYSRDDVIGEVVCPLSGVDLTQIENQQVALSREIQPRSLKIRAQGRGELLISLCWQPAAARLTVVLLKARNLPRMDVTGLADPYVKIYLLFNGQRIAKKKTHVKKRTLSPVFNESFAFDIPTTEGAGASLDGVSLELMLLDWDRVTKNEVIGRLELGGPRCTGTALTHWNEVCNSPRRQIAEWHKLNE